MPLYKKIALKEGVLVQYVGVYVLKWQQAWGQPEVGFVEVRDDDEPDNKIMDPQDDPEFRDR